MYRLALLGLMALFACTKPIEQEWSVATEGSSKCTPVLLGEFVIFGNEGGYLHAFDRQGNERWSFTAHRDIIGAPSGYRDLVFFGAVNNVFYGVNLATGREAWKFMAKDRIKGGSILFEDKVIFGSYDKHLYALTADKGKLAWVFPPESGGPAKESDTKSSAGEEPAVVTGEFSYARPLLVDGIVYVGNLDGYLYAIDARDGTMKWRFKTGKGITSSAIFKDGVLYFGSNDHNVYALDLSTQKPKWTFQTNDEVNASPRWEDGVLYVGGVDTTFYAIDAGTGKARWTYNTKGRIVDAAAVYKNLVFVGSGPGDGTLYALDRGTGKLFWKLETQSKIEADPVVEGDRLYVVVGDGRLIVLKINKTT
jgi:eukaryotic-like serine/threonine-protein kinase